MGRNKRKRPFGETIRKEYSATEFETRKSSGRPRSPHRFFFTSYTVSSPDNTSIQQVVHKHVNGLCIVTAGETIPSSIQSIKFIAKEAPACSAGEKRKRQTRMLQGSTVEDAVSPCTKIAELHLQDGTVIPLLACVFGTILELNQSLTPEILQDDPLLDGFLAVILPSGDYPPREEEMKQVDESTAKEDNEIKEESQAS